MNMKMGPFKIMAFRMNPKKSWVLRFQFQLEDDE